MANRYNISGQTCHIKVVPVYFSVARLNVIANAVGCSATTWSDSKPWPNSTKEVL
jgi:hypothetical protein